ncbi:MAG: NAD(P)(+) transhydrogenase (Re/Si-specific) subunit beta [Holosporaceae bacterium]|jgi:NAD(P) transhydrogenase subunit beta|nr:NAD(P)(+) transhydrogenase (Re/Si-specific) subunit beta [Holosporaceae bacterium]
MIDTLYIISSICFIFALNGLASAETALRGNICGIVGIVMAFAATIISMDISNICNILLAVTIGGAIGIFVARGVLMTALPQLIAGFHSLVGLSAVLIAFSVYYPTSEVFLNHGSIELMEIGLGSAIGAITFSGSVIAFLKLHGLYKGSNINPALNTFLAFSLISSLMYFVITENHGAFVLMNILSFIIGATLLIPIGGADMPVMVSLLNSCSGWAASGIGFTLQNDLLIITGALVGASGAILSYVMCKGMNRSLINIITEQKALESTSAQTQGSIKQGAPEDAAFILKNAKSVIIVPGYGMATSHAQHALKEMSDMLKKKGISVKYAIHPVAGRMPGHMNVLLAEAGVLYDDVFELKEINQEFSSSDVAYVVGANDVTNPSAKKDPSSPIYGMPILEVEKAKVVLFVKRSMATGYSGIDNELFYAPNTIMLLGDAKKMTESIVKTL